MLTTSSFSPTLLLKGGYVAGKNVLLTRNYAILRGMLSLGGHSLGRCGLGEHGLGRRGKWGELNGQLVSRYPLLKNSRPAGN